MPPLSLHLAAYYQKDIISECPLLSLAFLMSSYPLLSRHTARSHTSCTYCFCLFAPCRVSGSGKLAYTHLLHVLSIQAAPLQSCKSSQAGESCISFKQLSAQYTCSSMLSQFHQTASLDGVVSISLLFPSVRTKSHNAVRFIALHPHSTHRSYSLPCRHMCFPVCI